MPTLKCTYCGHKSDTETHCPECSRYGKYVAMIGANDWKYQMEHGVISAERIKNTVAEREYYNNLSKVSNSD